MALTTVPPSVLAPNVNSKDVAEDYSKFFSSRVVVAPNGVKQIGSFAFDYKGGEEVNLRSEATDHWLENNTVTQNSISVKPVEIKLRGFVSELALNAETTFRLQTLLTASLSTLSQVPLYLGSYTPGAVDAMSRAIAQAQSVALQIEQAAAFTAQLASYFLPGPALNKQQAAFARLEALQLARVVFTVFTPFKVYSNMAITSIRAAQDKTTKTMSDFSVDMQQINIVGNEVGGADPANFAGRRATDTQSVIQNGGTPGEIVSSVERNILTLDSWLGIPI